MTTQTLVQSSTAIRIDNVRMLTKEKVHLLYQFSDRSSQLEDDYGKLLKLQDDSWKVNHEKKVLSIALRLLQSELRSEIVKNRISLELTSEGFFINCSDELISSVRAYFEAFEGAVFDFQLDEKKQEHKAIAFLSKERMPDEYKITQPFTNAVWGEDHYGWGEDRTIFFFETKELREECFKTIPESIIDKCEYIRKEEIALEWRNREWINDFKSNPTGSVDDGVGWIRYAHSVDFALKYPYGIHLRIDSGQIKIR
jgi:hypothetical protein